MWAERTRDMIRGSKGRWLVILAAVCALGLVLALVVASSRATPEAQLQQFRRTDAEHDCCRRGIPLGDGCDQALGALWRARDGDPAAAEAVIAQCPAARELDPARPHPPEERLCGFTAIPAQREAAAKELAATRRLDVALMDESCRGFTIGFTVLAQDFAAQCADDACLDLLQHAGARAPEALRAVHSANATQIRAALQKRLSGAADRSAESAKLSHVVSLEDERPHADVPLTHE